MSPRGPPSPAKSARRQTTNRHCAPLKCARRTHHGAALVQVDLVVLVLWLRPHLVRIVPIDRKSLHSWTARPRAAAPAGRELCGDEGALSREGRRTLCSWPGPGRTPPHPPAPFFSSGCSPRWPRGPACWAKRSRFRVRYGCSAWGSAACLCSCSWHDDRWDEKTFLKKMKRLRKKPIPWFIVL